MNPNQFVICCLLILISLELIRLYFGIIIVGQREYEAKQISALAWGAFAVCLALIFSPESKNFDGMESGLYAAPLIWGLTFVDPIMGEIKRSKKGIKFAIIGGLITSYIIWVFKFLLSRYANPCLVNIGAIDSNWRITYSKMDRR
tara:strand:+ start:179 stop:613 length:435 start_codon:yes stop_codon:yes gene_type:complete